MSRESFKNRFPVPEDAMYNADLDMYVWRSHPRSMHPHENKWEVWQAAQAQAELDIIYDDNGCPTEVRIAQAQAVNQQLLDALEDMFEAAGSIPADPKNFKKYPALMPSMCKARDAILAAKQAAKRQE
jgi:hypothetical protein